MRRKGELSRTKLILSDVLILAFEHIKVLSQELSKIDIKSPELSDELKDRAQTLSHILTLVNDIIHPAHETALTIFPAASDMIEFCIKNQRLAIENKIISPQCDCYSCTVRKNAKKESDYAKKATTDK